MIFMRILGIVHVNISPCGFRYHSYSVSFWQGKKKGKVFTFRQGICIVKYSRQQDTKKECGHVPFVGKSI